MPCCIIIAILLLTIWDAGDAIQSFKEKVLSFLKKESTKLLS